MDTETKLILHQDKNAVTASLAVHKKVAAQMNVILAEIKDLGVEPTQVILNDLFESGEQIKKKLANKLEKQIADYILPFHKEKARVEFKELLGQVDRIVRKVDQEILQRNRPHTTYIETTVFTFVPGGIVLDEQFITDQFTLYLDSPDKIRIKELAEALLASIAEFNGAVHTASNGKVAGLTQNSPDSYYKIIELFGDGSLSIDFTSFGGIK